MKKTKTILLPLGVLLCVLCVGWLTSDWFQAYRLIASAVAFGISLIVFFVSLYLERKEHKETQKRMDDVFSENSEIAAWLVNQVSIPCALIEQSGTIVWRNESMQKIFAEPDICRVQPHFDFFAPLVAMRAPSRQPALLPAIRAFLHLPAKP